MEWCRGNIKVQEEAENPDQSRHQTLNFQNMKPHTFSTACFFVIIVFVTAWMSCSDNDPVKPIPPVNPPNVDKLVFSPHEVPLGKTYAQ